MDYTQDSLDMLDLMDWPAFYVKDGVIIRANYSAEKLMISAGMQIESLLKTGLDEYRSFQGGNLFLTLKIADQVMDASVIRIRDLDVFRIESDPQQPELRAMSLSAQQLRGDLADAVNGMDRLSSLVDSTGNPDAQHALGSIRRSLFRSIRDVGNMSDAPRYSSGSAGRKELRNIKSVFHEMISDAAVHVEQAGRHLLVTDQLDPILMLLDHEKLERAFYNILANALLFSPADSDIDIRLSRKNRFICLTVSNSLSDSKTDLSGTLFSRYRREPALEDSRTGIGLGMLYIRTAASSHEGTVLVEQSKEAGFRITVTFKINQPTGSVVKSGGLHVDYAGELNHTLIELSDSLPAALYQNE